MMNIRKIMVPVDFSEPSKKAVIYGLSLALQFKAGVILTHVAPFDKRKHEEAKERLLTLIPSELRERLDCEMVVTGGDIREEIYGNREDKEILRNVQDKEIDLVVMGSRGRSYVGRMLLGSVTERILRQVPVPIMTVSHLDPQNETQEPETISFQRILYASDLTEGFEVGLQLALRLARDLDAQITVVHAAEPPAVTFRGIETAGYELESLRQLRANAGERLNRSVALVSDGSVPVTTAIVDGVAHEVITRVALEQKSDLIVINLWRKGRVEKALLGTTAEHLIRTAGIPVLSLPMPAAYASNWLAA